MAATAAASRARHPCPTCGEDLVVVPGRLRHWACAGCGGRGVLEWKLPPSLRRSVVERMRLVLDAGGMRGVRRCPFCLVHLLRIRVDLPAGPLALDGCSHCRLFWFDAGELDAAEGRRPPPSPTEVDERRPRSLSFAPPADLESPLEVTLGFPAGGTGGLIALFGLPLEEGGDGTARCPAAWTLAAAMAAATLLAMGLGLRPILREWGFSPEDPFRHGGLTLVSSFLLHGGLFHLAGNAWFLLAFGDDVEEELGSGPFLLLVVLATLAGHLLFVLCAWKWDGVTVGASGGISGVVVFYGLAFPRRRLRMLWFAWFTPLTTAFTARAGLAAWVGFQVLGAFSGYSVMSHVNYWAHLGGAAVGAACWWWVRRGGGRGGFGLSPAAGR